MKNRQTKRIMGLKKKAFFDILYIIFFTLVLAGSIKAVKNQLEFKLPTAIAQASFSPIYPEANHMFTPLPTQNPLSEQEQIREYIKEVFGKHSDKAFALLTCENASLNPSAVNTAGNYPEGSKDIGVFQINEYWQDVNSRFLYNWKINIQIAYQIFSEDDNSFKMWSCSKKLGGI